MAQDTTPEPAPAPRELNRRTVVAGAGLATIGAGLVVAGCATSAAPATATGGTTAAVPTAAAPPAAGGAGTTLGPASGVPVGGGAIFAAQKVVVTQASAGTYVGLSAVCTHQGCIVAKVAAGTIDCACHGSRYNLDGSVAKGPAAKPLAPVAVSVTGGSITLA